MSDNRGPVERYRGLRVAAMLSTAGLTLALSVVIGVAIGYFLDRWLNTRGIMVIVFAIVGVVAGFKQLIQIVARANAEQEEADAAERRRSRGEEDDR
jgi:ATP synthase protein I